MPAMNMLPGGSTLQIPLEACTAFSASAGNAQVELTWTDPKDKYATPEGDISDTGDQLVSEWDHTVLVRKTGSQPAGPNDGTVVVSSSVRNQYQTTAYTDIGLTNDTTYYYGVFAYNKDGVASPGAFTNATPKSYEPVLNDNTWEQIQAAAAAGVASSVWAVGDCKEIVLNGSAGNISLSNYPVCAFILGFNHNAALEGNNTIHFQLGKTALAGGTDICFWSEQMNNVNSSAGGWKSSKMRNSVLGTSVSSYSGKFIGVLPQDLRAVLKPVQKYTNNMGDNDSQSAISATTDYIFLLSEFELFARTSYSNSYEANYQEQYGYYASSNSKRRYRHNKITEVERWLERSPTISDGSVDYDGYFCCVSESGGPYREPGGAWNGVAPAFVVG